MGMLTGVVGTIGRVLRPIHAGEDKLASRRLQRNRSPTLVVMSDAFADGATIPERFTRDGNDISPPLRWTRAPHEAKEIVLVCEDPDAPRGRPFLHWIAYGIEPHATELPEGIAKVPDAGMCKQAKNGAHVPGYSGPAPLAGHGKHHYHFQVFVLGERLRLSAHPERDEIIDAMRGHITGYGELVGIYERRPT
jgi:Raf kinase inhibitor-like YbhB/YbcL family protein